ncbi:hypothetical protein B0O99DRAFT_685404 [Bisporella sp. PMI_857]|nr:hypothetical protein B0O99DRAFT_685404 [Bisporella sp. PMI_857]
MVKNPSITSSGSGVAGTNLERMLERLNFLLVTPDAATEEQLRTSKEARSKVAANIQYSRDLLLELEQDVTSIRIQSRKHDLQSSLVRQREQINMLAGRLRELNELGESGIEIEDESGEEDLIGEDTPDEGTETETDDAHTPPGTASISEYESRSIGNLKEVEEEPSPSYKERDPVPSTELSTLRQRTTKQDRQDLFSTSAPSSTTTGIETTSKTAEQLMSHNRAEQELLTSSMLSMAAQLKQQSRAFAASLESEKDILDRAARGLDKNESGLATAQEKMGFLRGYTEGKGWWGRMLMYVWIFGLMVVAILVVFVMPKLRF